MSATTIDFHQLDCVGYLPVSGIRDTHDLLGLANSLGRLIPGPSGQLVKRLSIVPKDKGPLGTFSREFGRGSFPLHTDTAFWPRPACYLVMRASGDIRRTTTVLSFARLIQYAGADIQEKIHRSAWVLSVPHKKQYCSMKISTNPETGYRYDPNCMLPANTEAVEIRNWLLCEDVQSLSVPHNWASDVALIISNWTALHGRGANPPNEQERILERIYVGETA